MCFLIVSSQVIAMLLKVFCRGQFWDPSSLLCIYSVFGKVFRPLDFFPTFFQTDQSGEKGLSQGDVSRCMRQIKKLAGPH